MKWLAGKAIHDFPSYKKNPTLGDFTTSHDWLLEGNDDNVLKK